MIILGIETSCDDTGIALVKCRSPQGCEILSNVVSSQIKIHAPFGGVVPNLAARAHLKNIEPCLLTALKEAKNPKIDLIGVTTGPGLIPSLLVGVNFAKALAYNWRKPILGINHLEAHIYANWLKPIGEISNSQFLISKNIFPALCLVVSGGHTQLILMKGHGKYKLLGQTRDDAAGEAFDKVAKLLNLGYPGGPIISQKAQKGNFQSFNLPRPMINSHNYDFSFSGLKTAVLYLVKGQRQKQGQSLLRRPLRTVPQGLSLRVPDICASFQQAAIDVLITKTIKAAKDYRAKSIMLSGGVAANDQLRKQFNSRLSAVSSQLNFLVPPKNLCTDNAAMVATTAFYRTQASQKQDWSQIQAQANLKLVA